MPLGFITPAIATIFVIIGVFAFLNAKVRALLGAVSFKMLDPKVTALVLIIAGALLGASWGIFTGWFTGLGVSTASAVDSPQAALSPQLETMLEKCEYTSGDASATGITIRTDPNSLNRVFLDVDESAWNATHAANNEANLSFTCTRGGNVQEDGSVKIVSKGAEFKSETSTTDSATYNILATSSIPSAIWSGKYISDVRLADNAYATSTSTREELNLVYAEGDKTQTLGVRLELDRTSYLGLNNYTIKDVTVYERSSSGDKPVAFVSVNKVP